MKLVIKQVRSSLTQILLLMLTSSNSVLIICTTIRIHTRVSLPCCMIGYLAAVYYCGAIVATVQWGRAADRWGRRYTLLAGTLTCFICLTLFGFSFNFVFALVTRFLWGVVVVVVVHVVVVVVVGLVAVVVVVVVGHLLVVWLVCSAIYLVSLRFF